MTVRERQSSRDRRSRVEETLDRARHIRHSAFAAGFEAIAGVADTARTFVREMVETEPFSRSRYWSDVVRDLPDSLADAREAALDTAIEIPHKAVDRFYEEYGSRGHNYDLDNEGTSMHPFRTRRRSTGPRSSFRRTQRPLSVSGSEQRVIDLVDSYLARVPGRGATMNSVVDHVVLDGNYNASIVRSVIKRHFLVVGPVVTKQRAVVETHSMDSIVEWMKEELKEYGYQDVREDYELTGVADMDEKAALVAFDGEDAQVLCYPVDADEVEDPSYHEAAKFQAGALAPGKVARVVWVSDGNSSYVFDMVRDSVLARVPRREEIHSSAASSVSVSERKRHGKAETSDATT